MKNFNSDLTSPLIEDYILEKTWIEDKLVDEMHTYAEINEVPIIGPLVGKYLYQIALITNAEKIFEMGSGFGYSAYWFAKAFKGKGKVNCTDFSGDHKEAAKSFFKKAGFENYLEFVCGNSLEILKESGDKYDIIFIDIDKEEYPYVIDITYDKLNKNGLMIADNTLWYGRVIEDDELPSTKGIKKFNNMMSLDKRFITTIIPLRDGITLSYKKN